MNDPSTRDYMIAQMADLRRQQTGGPPPELCPDASLGCPTFVCVACSSLGPFKRVSCSSPVKAPEYEAECQACGSTDVREEGEALSEITEERERLREERDRYRKALEYYADPKQWPRHAGYEFCESPDPGIAEKALRAGER